MSLLSEIKAAVTGCGLPVETGVFSGEPPEEYVVGAESEEELLGAGHVGEKRP